jgi:hypothetical protein
LYRSRDRTLPDFSKVKDSDFELFFDVSSDNLSSRGSPRDLIDLINQANALSPDGTTSLSTYSMSRCGKYFAYVVSHSVSVTVFSEEKVAYAL